MKLERLKTWRDLLYLGLVIVIIGAIAYGAAKVYSAIRGLYGGLGKALTDTTKTVTEKATETYDYAFNPTPAQVTTQNELEAKGIPTPVEEALGIFGATYVGAKGVWNYFFNKPAEGTGGEF